ncbi:MULTISPECIES: sirohydrochlorin chelatase [unclassified Bacillus (in: firmicutes)]|uniref:sirohydrochlorin chelatase n=1 Tax=unclassified Bacillus (in: firmicutes) TaxID=185979 RepID=UPI0008E54665|nr:MULTISPECIES: sirohydrochlorin chelatase [unclassified Bacillus (in: firmicutes)]SFI96962.1 Sirohydrochlorin ferrochelatase [Bacillus sp. 71mf]SFS63902.1 Sirohydrochlorin ferrochelatase [Bacillus sp. 103mf]
MKAVLYICHGSRVQEACEEAVAFVTSCMERISAPIQELCFLELASPSIAEGVAACVQKGANQIVIVPVFLLAAVHVKIDIPKELGRLQNQYPYVSFSYGNPFGVSRKLVTAILDGSGMKSIGKRVTLLLVARGSSDEGTLRDVRAIASLFEAADEVEHVEVCYLAAAKPRFEEKLHELVQTTNAPIVILPYLLFTGLLMKIIEKTVRKYNHSQIVLCPYVSKNQAFQDMLIKHTEEMIRENVYVSINGANKE